MYVSVEEIEHIVTLSVFVMRVLLKTQSQRSAHVLAVLCLVQLRSFAFAGITASGMGLLVNAFLDSRKQMLQDSVNACQTSSCTLIQSLADLPVSVLWMV